MYRNIIFLVKLIGQWIPGGNGRGIARDIKTIIVILKTQQKMVTKLGQFTKLWPFSTFQLFKLSKLSYHFLSRFENENTFFSPSYPLPIAVQNSLTNQFYTKIEVSIDWKKKKWQVFSGTLLYISVWHIFCCCWKYTETLFFLVKLIGQWTPDGDGRGIARDIKKNIFIFKTRQQMVKFGQFKKLNFREGSHLCKLSQLGYLFLESFENENNFFLYT